MGFKKLVRCHATPSGKALDGFISEQGDECDLTGYLNAGAMFKKDPEEKLAELKTAFATFDKNGDGVISLEEFKTVMCKMGEAMPEEDAEAIFKDCDVNNTGVLGMEEFAV